MARTMVMGDIHGSHLALKQCLERSKFDYDNDVLIQLGDVADGWKYVYECVEILLSIRNLVAIKGNHDEWFAKWLETWSHPDSWRQGGYATAISYLNATGNGHKAVEEKYSGWKIGLYPDDIPPVHREFWLNQLKYHKDERNNLYVHAGFDRHKLLSEEKQEFIFWWDRDLWSEALSFQSMIKPEAMPAPKFKMKETFNEIFIGHTTTNYWNSMEPMKAANIWNLDTGAGWAGKLTIMDVDTHEYWQSDNVKDLYPGELGRR